MLERACALGLEEACRSAPSPIDPSARRASSERACLAGDAEGCALFAFMLARGVGGERDPARALAMQEDACSKGSARACNDLGVILAGRKETERAREAFAGACARDEGPACSNLGLMWRWGTGGPSSEGRARSSFERACFLGFAAACDRAGRMALHGFGGPANRFEAARMFEQACAAGFRPGCDDAGDIPRRDFGIGLRSFAVGLLARAALFWASSFYGLEAKLDAADLDPSRVVFAGLELADPSKNGWSFEADRLALDLWRPAVHARRALVTHGRVRVALGVDVRVGTVDFEITGSMPPTDCNDLLEALPPGLKDTVRGTRLEGRIALDFRAAVDRHFPERTRLDADLENGCRIASYGVVPEPGRLRGPFAYLGYDARKNRIRLETGKGTPRWTSYADISPYMVAAVIAREDPDFWQHRGFKLWRIRHAVEHNLRKHALETGVSSLDMQLAKNLFLSRSRTFARKLEELFFVWYLEGNFTKQEIAELYLNVVEFGPSIYGIREAAMHYFGRSPSDLSLAESAFLARLLPSPILRHASRDLGRLTQEDRDGLQETLDKMRKGGRITRAEHRAALEEDVVFHRDGTPLPALRPVAARPRTIAATTRDEGPPFDALVGSIR
jgi:hypothetical protein